MQIIIHQYIQPDSQAVSLAVPQWLGAMSTCGSYFHC